MNTNYYGNPMYPSQKIMDNSYQNNAMGNNASNPNIQNQNLSVLTEEQSYIENILRLNRGKLATLYFSFPDSVDWRDKTFTGVIEAAGRDHIVISDPQTGKWYLLLMIYLNYVEFDEKINYSYPYYQNVQ